jgi:hypothetical protein
MTDRPEKSDWFTLEDIDVAGRLKIAEAEKDWVEVCDILYDACDYAPEALKSLVPRYIEHHYWNLRATVVEVVGIRRLSQFSGLVAARLRDRNADVRSYALMAHYELLGVEALPAIDEFCTARNITDRVTALVLRYVETADPDAIKRLDEILGRKGCKPLHCQAAMNIFDYYYDSNPDDQVVGLFKAVLPNVPKEYGWAPEMERMLAQWKRVRTGRKKESQS